MPQAHLLGVLLLQGREDVVIGRRISDRASGNPITRSIKSLDDFRRAVTVPIKTTRQQINVPCSVILPARPDTHVVLQLLEHLAHVLVPVLLGGAELVLDGLAQLVCLGVQLFAHALHVVQLRAETGCGYGRQERREVIITSFLCKRTWLSCRMSNVLIITVRMMIRLSSWKRVT